MADDKREYRLVIQPYNPARDAKDRWLASALRDGKQYNHTARTPGEAVRALVLDMCKRGDFDE